MASFDIRKSSPLGIGDEPPAQGKGSCFRIFGVCEHIDLPNKYVFSIQDNVKYASGRRFAAWIEQSGLSFDIEQSIFLEFLFGGNMQIYIEASCNNFFLVWGYALKSPNSSTTQLSTWIHSFLSGMSCRLPECHQGTKNRETDP